MTFQNLCPPALIYLIFSITQVVIDTVKGLYNTALVKVWVAFIFTILLNYLCQLGLGIISWFIVFIPFVLMTLVVAILLLMFGLDPATGKIKVLGSENKNNTHNHHKHGKRHDDDHGHHPPPASEDKVYKPDEDVLKYYKSNDASAGGSGGEATDGKVTETKNEKTNRILNKSLLFYSESANEGDTEKPSTEFKADKEHLDTTKFKIFVNSTANILAGMGEQEISSDFQTKALACINSANKMKKEEAQKSIMNCYDELIQSIVNRFDEETGKKFLKQMEDINCKPLEPQNSCKKRVREGWWN
jgi:hypothetical protein